MISNFIIKVLFRLKLLNAFNLTGSIRVNYLNVKIPVIGKVGYSNLHIREPWMSEVLTRISPIVKSGTVIDAGVNVGQTLIKLKCNNPGIDYIGFEPNPICVFYVKELIRQNNYQNCRLIPVGLSKQSELIEINYYHESLADSTASIIGDFRPGEKVARKEFIPVLPFREIEESLGTVKSTLIKIDVEGAELEVLTGMKEIINRDKPIILCEILPSYNEKNLTRINRQKQIEEYLSKAGYIIFRIDKTEDDQFKGFDEIKTFGIHGNLNQCEYLFAPESLKESII